MFLSSRYGMRTSTLSLSPTKEAAFWRCFRLLSANKCHKLCIRALGWLQCATHSHSLHIHGLAHSTQPSDMNHVHTPCHVKLLPSPSSHMDATRPFYRPLAALRPLSEAVFECLAAYLPVCLMPELDLCVFQAQSKQQQCLNLLTWRQLNPTFIGVVCRCNSSQAITACPS